MAALRVEADESASLAEELKAKVKQLEQENLAKEQEITSLSHKNQVLEADLEKAEGQVKDLKVAADEGGTATSHNESLTRKLQVLEEEAEQADRNLRETNEKCVALGPSLLYFNSLAGCANHEWIGFARPTSRPAITSARSRPSSSRTHNGRPSTRRWPRSMPTRRRSWTTLSQKSVPSNFCYFAQAAQRNHTHNKNHSSSTHQPFHLLHSPSISHRLRDCLLSSDPLCCCSRVQSFGCSHELHRFEGVDLGYLCGQEVDRVTRLTSAAHERTLAFACLILPLPFPSAITGRAVSFASG